MDQYRFVNPYNFIKLPEKKARAYGEPDVHTGAITYTITTKSPLFIPNTSNDDAFCLEAQYNEHKSYDFFSYQELETGTNYSKKYYEPVIPGSEIRGMLRSIYETLTDSCMSVFNDGIYPERRIGDVFLPGLICRNAKGSYTLYEATGYRIREELVDKGYTEGQKLYFREKSTLGNQRVRGNPAVGEMKSAFAAGWKCGYLIKGMPFSNKRNYYLFELNQQRPVRVLSVSDMERLDAVLQSYQSQPGKTESYKEYQKALKVFKEGKGNECFPVRYSLVQPENGTGVRKKEALLYLSPAAITKEIARTPLKDVLGEFHACEHYQNCCPACDLFGMVGIGNEDAIGSKIRFSDARIQTEKPWQDCYEQPLTREILGSPKLSNTEFYLERPKGADAWNYDYYVKDGQLFLYSEEVPLRIRGRKFYCHQPDVVLPRNIEKTKFNATVRPVKRGVVFQGKLYFENISWKQLRQLLWILGIRTEDKQSKSGDIAFKLGSGKPLGFGSVQLQAVSWEERKVSCGEDRIVYETISHELKPECYEAVDFSPEVKTDFLLISSLDYTNASEVSYPYVVTRSGEPARLGTTVEEGYAWFQENKGNRVQKRTRTQIRDVLPSIAVKYLQALPADGVKTAPQKQNRQEGAVPRRKNPGDCVTNQVYRGTITGYYPKGVLVTLDGSKKLIKLYHRKIKNKQVRLEDLETSCPLNTRAELTYRGKNEEGFPQWDGILL